MSSHPVMNEPSFGRSGIPLPASAVFSAVIHVCHAAIHVALPSSGNDVSLAAVPARRGSWFAPLPPHHPWSNDGDAESNMMPSYSPAATCASSDCTQ